MFTETHRILSMTALLALASLTACGGESGGPSPPPPPPPPPPTGNGSLSVITATLNLPAGPVANYTLTIDGSRVVSVPADGTTLVADVAPGNHSAVLTGIPAACTMNPAPAAQSVTAGATADLAFVVICPGTQVNGDRIVFSRFNGNWDVMTMDADGSNPLALAATPFVEFEPRWSPDGKEVAYNSNNEIFGVGVHVLVVNADGTNLRRISTTMAVKGGLAWSPDGSRIAWGEQLAGRMSLRVANKDGSGEHTLTDGTYTEDTPDWSPNGREIVVAMATGGTLTDIGILDTESRNLRLVIDRPGSNRYPRWSPDGRKIAFEGQVGDVRHIFLVNPDGTGLVNLTGGHAPAGDNREPAWSPDGTKIVFGSTRLGDNAAHFNLYVMDADGRNVTRLTNFISRDRHPDWRRAMP